MQGTESLLLNVEPYIAFLVGKPGACARRPSGGFVALAGGASSWVVDILYTEWYNHGQ